MDKLNDSRYGLLKKYADTSSVPGYTEVGGHISKVGKQVAEEVAIRSMADDAQGPRLRTTKVD